MKIFNITYTNGAMKMEKASKISEQQLYLTGQYIKIYVKGTLIWIFFTYKGWVILGKRQDNYF